MHELSIAAELVRRVSDVLEHRPGSRPVTLTVSVGAYSGVDPAALAAAFPVAAEGTPVRGAGLAIERVAPSYACRDCGAALPDLTAAPCLSCGSTQRVLASGRELDLIALEVVSDEDD